MNRTKCSKIGFVSYAALLGALTGCVAHVDGPRPERVYVQPPPAQVDSGVLMVQDDYVYYPGYQVYYSGRTHQYIYQDGRSWVTRNGPPRVSVDVLFASPSVRLDFHDSPSIHHAAVVRQYPKHWSPAGSNHGNRDGRDEGDGDGNKGNKGKGNKGNKGRD